MRNKTIDELNLELEFLSKKIKEYEDLQWVREKEEKELHKLNRALKTISQCNQVLVRSKNEFALIQQICDIIVDTGKYKMAWVGYAKDDYDKTVEPVAYSGNDKEYFKSVNIRWSDSENGNNPAGKAIRFRKTQILQDITSVHETLLRKDETFKNEFLSVISLPLLFENECFGAITIFSDERDTFDSSEENLLQELADDLAYGIFVLRNQEKREKSEQELKNSEENYRKLVEISPNAIAVHENGKFVFINKMGCKIIGARGPEDLIGRPVIDFVHPDYRKSVIKRIIQMSEGKEVPVAEERLIALNGKVIDVILASSLMTFHGKQAIQVVINDITKMKEVENALRESEERYRSIFENAQIGILRTSIDGKILMANPALVQMLGYDSTDELSAVPAWNIYDDKSSREKLITMMRGKKNINGFETVFRKKDGSKINIRSNLAHVINENGEEYLEGTIEDITAKRKIEDELIFAKEKAEEMNRIKTSFLSNMSHELRTPLVSILGFAEIFQSEFKDGVYNEMAKSIYNSGYRLLETLNSILDFSKIEINKIEIKMEKLNVAELIKKTVENYLPAAEAKNLYIKTEIKLKDAIAKVDSQMFDKIINNLVNNGIKYTMNGGVTIKVAKNDIDNKEWISINIIDTGIGIPKDRLEIIFDPFRQASEGLNRNYEGSGLGLTITRKLVEMLDGKVLVESEPGAGSRFTILLPLLPNDKKEKLMEPVFSNIVKNCPEELPEILLVENDEPTIDVTKILLRKFYKIDVASTGQGAVDSANKKNYSAILMDINLGAGIDGIETMKIIRKLPAYFNVPIVAFTAYAMVGDKEKFLKFGFDEYIAKPFEKKALMSLMNRIFDKVHN